MQLAQPRMKRSAPLRRTPLKRGGPIKSKGKSHAVPKDIYAQVVARDNGCAARTAVREISCDGRLDPHHIQRRSQGGADTVENLVTLCRAHHRWVHEHPALSKSLGLLAGHEKESQ